MTETQFKLAYSKRTYWKEYFVELRQQWIYQDRGWEQMELDFRSDSKWWTQVRLSCLSVYRIDFSLSPYTLTFFRRVKTWPLTIPNLHLKSFCCKRDTVMTNSLAISIEILGNRLIGQVWIQGLPLNLFGHSVEVSIKVM